MNPLDLLALASGLAMVPFLPAMYREVRGTDRDRPAKIMPPHIPAPIHPGEIVVLVPVAVLIVTMAGMLALGVIA